MRVSRSARLAAGAALLVGLGATPAPPAGLPARTLDGTDVSVPGDLPPGAFLIVGFSRASNAQTEPWRQALDGLELDGLELDGPEKAAPPTYSVLVLEGAPRWVRGFIVRAIRRAVPDEEHHSILVVTQNSEGWRTAVGFDPDAEDAAYVVRLDGLGATCFRHAGPVTEDALRGSRDAECTAVPER